MTTKRAAGFALSLLALAGCATAPASSSSDRSSRLEGLWALDRGLGVYGRGAGDLPGGWFAFDGFRGAIRPPPLRPEAYETVRARKAVEQLGRGLHDGADPQSANCLPSGFPDMMEKSEPLEILQREGEVVMISERERTLPRHIHLDQTHPNIDDYGPTVNGHAVGRWEGDVLVVDTIGFDPKPWLFTYDRIPRSDALHTVERIRLEPGGQALVNELTITDPKTLTEPWTLVLRFNRAAPNTTHFESVCVPQAHD